MLELANGSTVALDTGGEPRCPRCESADYTTIFRPPLGIELGGDAGVGKHYPYRDRALGPGAGLLVNTAAERRKLMTHYPTTERLPDGSTRRVLVERDARLVPLEERPSASRHTGTWADIADAEAEQAEQDAAVYAEMLDEQNHGPERATYAKARELLPTALRDTAGQPIRAAGGY